MPLVTFTNTVTILPTPTRQTGNAMLSYNYINNIRGIFDDRVCCV